MKRTIVLLSAVLLMSAVASATTDPDGFEGYATGDWGTGENGWTIAKMYGVEGGQVASILDDGGDQILDIFDNGGYGMTGFWDADGPADADVAVTTSGFDFSPVSGSMGSEFHMRNSRHELGNNSNQATWTVGARVSLWGDYSTPHSPYTLYPDCWASTGTYVYLRTWIGGGDYIVTEIPGFGEGVHIVPGIVVGAAVEDCPGADPGISPEWYTVEVEEDNALNKTRARMYVRGGTPSAWTPWQDHEDTSGYASGGSMTGFWGGAMQFDNVYITPEPATMLLLGAGSLLLIRRKRR